ncbi:hypothetical protein [Georgenia sp. Marseille-Q6866]
MSIFVPAVAIAAVLVWAALLLNHPQTRVPLLCGTGFFLVVSSAGVLTVPVAGVAARPAGVALIALAALTSPVPRPAGAPALAGRWALALCAPLATYVVLTTAPNGQWNQLALYLVALCLPAVLVVSTGSHLTVTDLRRGLAVGLAGSVAGSLAVAVVRPDLGIEGGRLRGLLENANGLGFLAFLLGGLAILVPTRWSRLSLVLSAVALMWSASRASALALVTIGLLELLRRRRYGLVASLAVALVLGVVVVTRLDVPMGPLEGLLRTTDSRSSSLATALADSRTSPLWGVGLNSESSIIASSPLRALSNGGALGLLCVALQAVLVLRASLVSGRATVFAAAGLFHSLFEGWLLSPSSPFLLVFAGAWILVARWAPAASDGNLATDVDSWRPTLTGRWAL